MKEEKFKTLFIGILLTLFIVDTCLIGYIFVKMDDLDDMRKELNERMFCNECRYHSIDRDR